MRFIIDMNLSPRWVEHLAEAGVEAQHWSSLGQVDAPDTAIMQFARENGYLVLTHDLDFGDILAATGGDGPSVVQLRAADVSPEAIGAHVVTALQQMAEHLDAGALLTVDPARARLRLLPLVRGE